MQNSIDVIIPIAAGTILLGILIGFIIFFVILYRKKQEEYEWDKEQAKQLLLKTQIEIKEQTLSNISRELHDNLGQVASLIKINLGMVNLENDNENTERVDESLSLIKQMILDIKTISTTLKGENLVRFGLYKMIKKDVDRLTKLGYVNIEINGTDELPEIGHEKEIFLYRMTQEIFNNVLQHSEATKAELLIEDLKNGSVPFPEWKAAKILSPDVLGFYIKEDKTIYINEDLMLKFQFLR